MYKNNNLRKTILKLEKFDAMSVIITSIKRAALRLKAESFVYLSLFATLDFQSCLYHSFNTGENRMNEAYTNDMQFFSRMAAQLEQFLSFTFDTDCSRLNYLIDLVLPTYLELSMEEHKDLLVFIYEIQRLFQPDMAANYPVTIGRMSQFGADIELLHIGSLEDRTHALENLHLNYGYYNPLFIPQHVRR